MRNQNLYLNSIEEQKNMEWILLEDMSKHMEEREVVSDSHHGPTRKNGDWLIWWSSMVEWLHQREKSHLDFCKAFDIPPATFLPLNWRAVCLMDELLEV